MKFSSISSNNKTHKYEEKLGTNIFSLWDSHFKSKKKRKSQDICNKLCDILYSKVQSKIFANSNETVTALYQIH